MGTCRSQVYFWPFVQKHFPFPLAKCHPRFRAPLISNNNSIVYRMVFPLPCNYYWERFGQKWAYWIISRKFAPSTQKTWYVVRGRRLRNHADANLETKRKITSKTTGLLAQSNLERRRGGSNEINPCDDAEKRHRGQVRPET